uniref:DUF1643 domain-containing protein n=1 Tax=Burkholderia anthina TaxID=179879 RepID=UPI0015883122|nr:DUF1643 domain-containing protein [Burkholderia anthina]
MSRSSCDESSDHRFRYSLERHWSVGDRLALFVMLNPSVADAHTDDPTIRRCVGFAKSWGYTGLRVVNLVPYRATDPDDMYDWLATIEHQALWENTRRVLAAARRTDVELVVCAWGTPRPVLWDYARQLHKALRRYRRTHAIKINSTGTPAHPLYLRADLQPVIYEPFGMAAA